jgi:hypothetical protein
VCVFHSQALYHGVTSWGPLPNVDQDGIPPGRTAHVFTTHASVFEWAEGLPDAFAGQTANGMMPSGMFSIPGDDPVWKYTGPKNPIFSIPSATGSEYPSRDREVLVYTPPFSTPSSQSLGKTVMAYKGGYSSTDYSSEGDDDNDFDSMDLDDD